MIWTLKVTCLAGPHHDEECIRYIETADNASLYDVHVAIQNAVRFDDEFEFAFFQAASPKAKRKYIPEGVDPREGVDTDLYEDVVLSDALPGAARRKLFYLFNLKSEWIFELQREPGEKAPSPHEFYPRVRDDRSVGPDPMQYGNAPDDYSAADEYDAGPLAAARRPFGAEEQDEEEEEDLSIRSELGSFGEDDDGDEVLDDEADEDDGDRW